MRWTQVFNNLKAADSGMEWEWHNKSSFICESVSFRLK